MRTSQLSFGWNALATIRNPATEAKLIGIARFGKIDALIHNAGFAQFGSFRSPHEPDVRGHEHDN